ncbi:MAG TPA: hypothetical protein DEF36_17880, partial [Desulfotomaculum sp.]|nr:hypothetical protein [Desulfotomaculum sp.]
MVKSYSKTEILKMVQEMRITPEEGFDLIKELEKGNGKRKQQVYLQDNTSLPKVKANTREVQPQVYDIAVIGMSGRFSGAENLDVFWDNLKKGVSSIGEVPRERWDINEYYHPNPKTPNKTYCKWLGLVPDADKFDPLFFNISPREAELMDPQHRLILEETWRALEDAGYSPGFFSGTKCGVFIGVMQGDYDQRLSGSGLDIQSVTGNLNSFIPARVSYFLNLLGPNMAIDTACSSSLVAVHQACKSIQSGESELALAGGVCIITTPATHISTSNGEMLSRDGKCKTFDNSADGFVPGEGVGVVALKALAKAIEDGDHIYGIIKGSRVNQDGKTNGITAPSSNSQAQLEAEVYETFGINPESISYVEAHGTGTKLGDPIEVSALTRSFRRHTEKKQYCAIGSVKTNIGHGLAAAGIAGLIKVLLCMKHNKIVPSLHFNKANEHINFKDSPFYVNTELKDWETEGPRRAAISSFGLSGTNCHMVVEEAPNTNIDGGGHQTAQAIIVLSAKKRERLLDQARQLLAAISEQQFSGLSLAHIAYTLQVGRQAMEERLAVLVSSIEELKEKLQGFVEGKDGIADMYRGQVRKNRETLAVFAADEELQEVINKWAQRGKYSKLLDLWVKGLAVDWSKLYEGGKPRRVSLPTYPFARERYWITGSQINTGDTTGKALAADSAIHPLLHKNTSDLTEQRFSSTFTGREFFLADHVVKGQSVLPGAACLEMARAAVEKAAGVSKEGKVGIRLKNVVWTRPVVVEDQPVRVHIGLFPEDNGQISYQIYTVAVEDAEPVVHSQGAAVLSPLTEVPVLDINVLLAECSLGSLSPVQCYQAFRSAGIDYGPGHQGIEKVYVGSGKVLAKLSLPLAVAGTLGQYTLHPGLLDSALQAAIGLLMDGGTAAAGSIGQLHPSLPFALQEIEIYSACASLMWALIRYSSGSAAGDKVQKLDIDVCDSEGKVCVRMRGFSSRVLENEAALAEPAKAVGTLMLQPTWKEQAIGREAQASAWEHRLVILCEPGKASLERMEKQSGVRCIALQTEQTGIAERFQTYAGRVFEEIQGILKDKIKGHVLVQVAVDSRDEGQLFSGLSGILKTARLENPKLMGQLIEVTDWEEIVKILDENSQSPLDSHVRYQDGKRRVAGWSQIEVLREEAGIPWEDKGVYLITGGAGGLGLILAGEIAQKVKGAALILTGRSPLGAGRQAKLKELEELGARIEYRQADVTRKEAVEDLIQSILEHFGKLNGIIHSAGVTRDSYIQKQTGEELQEVLGPKVAGLVNLDHSSREIGLHFLVLFSSIAGGLGNIGQTGYSAANAFMDAYAG